MSKTSQKSCDRSVIIYNSGDLSIDYHIQERKELRKFHQYVIDSKGTTFLQVGNAALTGKLLSEMVKKEKINVKIYNLFQDLKPENVMTLPRSFSIIRKFGEHENDRGEKEPSWRIAQYLHRTENKIDEDFYDVEIEQDIPHKPDILVLSDYNGRFRDAPSCWPRVIYDHNGGIPLTFLRCSHPFDKKHSELLYKLINKSNTNKNLIIVTTIDDLRQCNNIKISQGLSWEETAGDLVSTINKSLSWLKQAAYLLVTINRFGVLLFHNTPDDENNYRLFFSNKDIEENEDMGSIGSMHGLNTGLMIHLIKRCVHELGNNQPINLSVVTQGILTGLSGITNAFNNGFKSDDRKEKHQNDLERLYFPTKSLFTPLKSDTEFFWIDIPEDVKHWSICDSEIDASKGKLIGEVISKGNINERLGKIPYSNFGNLYIVGKRELEESREIKKLIITYSHKLHQTKPLSIAVFGDPGAGKSHTIEKMAESLFKSQKEILKFNLSQFTDSHMLNEAFHQIRDVKIDGKTVIVFWDEFDSTFDNEIFGWTKHFLSPMQDGTFNEGSIKHPIGQSIFIFISSKFRSLEELRSVIPDENIAKTNDHSDSQEKKVEIKNDDGAAHKKGPENGNICPKIFDFLSRLQGHIEISGTNPREDTITNELKLRRAILFRSFLEKHCPTIINVNNEAQIDPSLVNAFMGIKEYKYGARSMEAIISMSHVDGTSKYTQSCLPANRQLSLHIDEEEFSQLLNENGKTTG